MDWTDRKVAKNVFRLALLSALLVAAYLLYSKYKAENLAEYERQNEAVQPTVKRADSVTPPDIRASVLREIDSIKKAGGEQPSFTIRVDSSVQPTASVASSPVPSLQKREEETIIKEKEENVAKEKSNPDALQGPNALFSHTYTIAVGKTIPVNILWASESGTTASLYKLITVKVDDIAGNKARFTIEDPFTVLLFSRTGYTAGDKIIIQDDRHHLNISVVQVSSGSAVIKVESRLTESLVSKLKKAA